MIPMAQWRTGKGHYYPPPGHRVRVSVVIIYVLLNLRY